MYHIALLLRVYAYNGLVKKVLIIDDDFAIQEALKPLFEFENLDAVSVTNALDIDSVDDSPDVILLDINLSGIKGTDLISNIRKNKSLSGAPVIVMSGADDIKEKAEEIKADAFIRKPFNFSDLVSLINKHII